MPGRATARSSHGGATATGRRTCPPGCTGVKAVSAGGGFSLALKNDGTVVAWGWNGYGQTNVPAGLTGVTVIAAGDYHSMALKSDGTVVAWGWNGYGQTNVPTGLTGVTAISAGSVHSLALKNDGTVVAWGSNIWGQTNVPAGLTGVKAISAGGLHNLALKNDGTVVAWGWNSSGQTNVPAGLTDVTAIAAGQFHSLALENDGTVVAWGDNPNGETNVPAGLTDLTAIAAGHSYSLALVVSDTTPPVISVPADMLEQATNPPLGRTVYFSATATDESPTNPIVTCTPASGSVFPIGVTTVMCSATDDAGNTATATFTVTVAPTHFYLHGAGATGNPPTLTVDMFTPTSSSAKYSDSGGVRFAGGNPWVQVGRWTDPSTVMVGRPWKFQTWVGLKNSDDQGTVFDVKADVYVNQTLAATATYRAVTGVTRNPSLATYLWIALGSNNAAADRGDAVSVVLSARIGTNPDGTKYPGHANATGLRVYYDSVERPTQMWTTLGH